MTSLLRIVPLALLLALSTGGCRTVVEPTGYHAGPADAGGVEVDLPATYAPGDTIVAPEGKAVLLRIPGTGKKSFGVLIGGYDEADGKAVGEARLVEMAATFNGDVAGVAVQIVDGWGYFFSYGYRPRGRGVRIAPVGVGTKFVLWVDPTEEVERAFLIKSDSIFDPDKMAVTLVGKPQTKTTITKPGHFAKASLNSGPLEINPKPKKSDAELAKFLATVEEAVLANGLPWKLKPLE